MTKPYPYIDGYESAVPVADPFTERSTYNAKVDRTDERIRRLIANAPTVSLHDHAFLLPADLNAENWGKWRAAKRVEFAYEGVRASGLTAGVFTSNSWHTAAEIETMFIRFIADLDHHENVHLVRRFRDLLAGRNTVEGELPTSVGVILGLESMTEFAHDLDSVEHLYGIGVRLGGMIYSDGNILGGGLNSTFDEGITTQGKAFVRQMNSIGMVVDLAHAGDKTTFDTIEYSEKPILVSHAGARSLWPTRRMKPDSLVKALAASGGLIGVEAAPNSTLVPGGGAHDISQVMQHAERLIEVGGIDSVALGLDVTYGPHHQLHAIRAQGTHTGTDPVDGRPASSMVDGLENPTESFWNIAHWLIEHGYSDEDASKLLGGNAVRYFEQVLVP